VLGTSRVLYGAILGSISLAYIGGTMLCRRLLTRYGLRGAVKRGAWFTLAGGLGMAALSLAGVHTVWAIVLPQYLYAIGHGVHQPCGQAGAVGPFPEKAGTAASLSGFAMTLLGARRRPLARQNLDDTVYPLTLGVGAVSVVLALIAWTLVQWHGEPGPRLADRAARCAAGLSALAVEAMPVSYLCLAGPTASARRAALAIAEASRPDPAGRDRQRRLGARLPRHGHRHAKPSAAERARVVPSPDRHPRSERGLLGGALRPDAKLLIEAIAARGRTPLLVGGTMLYFKALFDGIDEMPAADPAIRAELEQRASNEGWPALHAELAAVDPVARRASRRAMRSGSSARSKCIASPARRSRSARRGSAAPRMRR
jgi:hypothetical protein